ncbi:protein of unknown function DUF1614 [Desulfofarcimen acetoxidans DSM 771]|jgi:uncharacterized membrane protein|uniref:DUF1614 domain-containing protein n=1 Tax=Desulfofarcimen acetoxidans (strain ATCC 49208 / DSM 771 / KCTC 5769 / VKM B-1644 / 5575) TaxID=485916 RepID=C8VZ22_DESAS|nr:DUF1614 domain-containing protein [Desulfofarcimen acetoxidans]ACV62932.1 protein of unknown function DUF1614 [Desulfofarcimen acetoxidans DSM 771]
MTRFPIGITALFIVSILIYLGLAQRVLDRMRLSDKEALALIAAIIIGSFISIPIPIGRFATSVNLGGAVVPVGLALYLLSKAGTAKEWLRALVATAITAFAVYYLAALINSGISEPAGKYAFMDAIYLYPLVGGLVAYLAGRSRRSAFISATLGVLVVDIIHYFWLVSAGAPAGTPVNIGGAGAFDAIVLSGVFAVLLAEIIGEFRERLQGGPKVKGRSDELLAGLRKPGVEQDKFTAKKEINRPDQGEEVSKDE